MMGHRIYTGPFAALEERWRAEVTLLQEGDAVAPVISLVGSNLLASHLKYSFVAEGRAVANLRFYTFLDLAIRLADEMEASAQKPRLPHLGAAAILESIVASQTPEVFAPVAAYAGFRGALLDTFRDLRDAGVSPKRLSEGIRRCLADSPDRGGHLLGLAALYHLFREKAGQFRGVDDDFHAAIRNTARAKEHLGARQLLIYGVYDVTGQQSDLLSGLKEALDLTYFIPYIDESVSVFARPFLEAREGELGVKHEALDAPPPASGLGRLWHLDFGFKTQGTWSESVRENQPLSDDGSFAFVSAPGGSRAAIEIVREILRAVQDNVIAGFHEAAVVLRQPETDIPILTEALQSRGIPYFVDGGTPFLRRPLARAVLAIAGLESDGYSRKAILRAMDWLAAALPADPAALWDVAEWRAFTNNLRFLGGINAWNEGTEALERESVRDLRDAEAHNATMDAEDVEDRRQMRSVSYARRRLQSVRALSRGWEQLLGAASKWPAFLSWRGWAQLLQQRLEPLLGASGDWERFSTILDKIESLTDMTDRVGTGQVVSRARMTAALEESLSATSCPEGRFLRNGVNLISISAARGLRFPLVIVPGLEEGRFPSRLRQDPLLLDIERQRIGRPSRLPLKSQRGDEEKLIFDMTARSATRRLVLVTSRLDEGSDREHIPSAFLLRAAAVVRGSNVGLRELAEGVVPGFRSVSLENPAPRTGQIAVDRGEIRLRLITAPGGARREALNALCLEEPELIKLPLAFDDARWQPALTEFDGRFNDRSLVRHIGGALGPAAGPVSASRLEAYAKCPYYFFLTRVMGLEAWEEPEAPQALDPLDRGQVIHQILERFLTERAGEAFYRALPEELEAALMAQARPALESVRPPGMQDLLWEIERGGLERLLRNWLSFEKGRAAEGLLPASLERPFGRFGPGESYPELRVQAGKHEFVFRGRIDRIDLSRDGKHARVIDYKTGALPDSMSRIGRPLLMAGEKMQVAVYRGALAELEGLEKVERIEGEYLHLQPKDGKILPSSFDVRMLSEASRRLPEILEIIGDGIENGVFFARSSGSVRPVGHCDYCEYLTVCGKDRAQREERKAGDPAVMRFCRLVEIDQPLEEGE